MIDAHKLAQRVQGASPRPWVYRYASSGAVTDATLLAISLQFDNTVMRKMTALTPDQMDKRFTTDEPLLASVKYDGEGVFLHMDEKTEPFLFNSSSGRVRAGLPLLFAVDALRERGVKKALFRCELYLPSDSSAPLQGRKRRSSADVGSVSASGNAEEVASLRLAVLDIVMLNGLDWRDAQSDFRKVHEKLRELFPADGPIHYPEGEILPEKNLPSLFAKGTTAGREGLVLRRLNRQEIYKVKPHLSIDAVVVGFVEGELETLYGVTSLLTALRYPEKSTDGSEVLQVFARVGSGFTDNQRTELLPQLSAMKVESPLHVTDSDGRLVHFIEPKWIVELHGEDLVETSSSTGRENTTQVLHWKGGKLQFMGLTAFPRLTFATFSQMRPEKSLQDGGARIAQVVERSAPVVRNAESGPRTVIRREVFTKGTDALRKLIVTQQEGAEVAPYVIYWTDYSSKRAEPLKVEVSAAFTPERMEAICAGLLAEKVTRGFEPMGKGSSEGGSATEAAEKPKAKAVKKAKTATEEAAAPAEAGADPDSAAAPEGAPVVKPARKKKTS